MRPTAVVAEGETWDWPGLDLVAVVEAIVYPETVMV